MQSAHEIVDINLLVTVGRKFLMTHLNGMTLDVIMSHDVTFGTWYSALRRDCLHEFTPHPSLRLILDQLHPPASQHLSQNLHILYGPISESMTNTRCCTLTRAQSTKHTGDASTGLKQMSFICNDHECGEPCPSGV